MEAIKEETEHESEEQARKEDGIDVIPVVENLHVLIKTMQFINNYSGIETADSEHDDTSINHRMELEHGTTSNKIGILVLTPMFKSSSI